jgi:hypothetical protein
MSSPSHPAMSIRSRVFKREKALLPYSSYSMIISTTNLSLKMAFLKAPMSSDS